MEALQATLRGISAPVSIRLWCALVLSGVALADGKPHGIRIHYGVTHKDGGSNENLPLRPRETSPEFALCPCGYSENSKGYRDDLFL